ncbi:cytochrome c1-like [Physella acuta]|uniref:cytochrome c1-like n=1 Tax=Physella acuta TaxID=109671 RepID=UPI0027DCD656|nr:cytochrome c1-like [Physella acuta]
MGSQSVIRGVVWLLLVCLFTVQSKPSMEEDEAGLARRDEELPGELQLRQDYGDGGDGGEGPAEEPPADGAEPTEEPPADGAEPPAEPPADDEPAATHHEETTHAAPKNSPTAPKNSPTKPSSSKTEAKPKSILGSLKESIRGIFWSVCDIAFKFLRIGANVVDETIVNSFAD